MSAVKSNFMTRATRTCQERDDRMMEIDMEGWAKPTLPGAKIIEIYQGLLDDQLAHPRKKFTTFQLEQIKTAREKYGMSGNAPVARATRPRTKTVTATANKVTTSSRKRKAEDDAEDVSTADSEDDSEDDNIEAAAPRKKAKTAATSTTTSKKSTISKKTSTKKAPAPKAPKTPAPKRVRVPNPPKPAPVKVIINEAPTKKLKIYVCGENSAGELGLGSTGNIKDVRRPRLNPKLLPDDVGIVQLAAGGMHVLAMTFDNRLMTWGCNDQGALGRDTSEFEGEFEEMDEQPGQAANGTTTATAASSSAAAANAPTTTTNGARAPSSQPVDHNGLNPLEATPDYVDMSVFPPGTVFTQVAASDSASLVLTDDGLVYGCGSFRNNSGILGFRPDVLVQEKFIQLKELKNIKQVAVGDNHALALDTKGRVFAWGAGQQNQLGRRVVERTSRFSLIPREFGLRDTMASVGCGAFHSFTVDKAGQPWAWGLNSYCETAIPETVGIDEAIVPKPQTVEALTGQSLSHMIGGGHHSLAINADGELLFWGRLDGHQSGMDVDDLDPADIKKDEAGVPRILMRPTAVTGIGSKIVSVATGPDHVLAVNDAGEAYSWGFSANYQTGQGTDEDVEEATLLDNTASRAAQYVWAGCGGQFAVLAAYE